MSTAAPSAPPADRLSRVLSHAAPAMESLSSPSNSESERSASPAARSEATGQPPTPASPASQPDPLALTIAARLILNAVGDAVFALANPTAAAAASRAKPASNASNAAQPDPVASSLTLADLLRHFLSDDERRILKVLASNPAGRRISGREVQAQTGITKNNFWVVWAQLQVRGLIVQTGYRHTSDYKLGADWLRLLLS